VRRFARAGHYPHRETAGELVPELLRFLDEPQPAPRVREGARAPRGVAVSPPERLAHPLPDRPAAGAVAGTEVIA